MLTLNQSFASTCTFAVIIRLLMLLYGEWQDAHLQVKYTDIDYKVLTDAARYVTIGESPYQRATYRYTPLLAFLLTPNIYVHKSFGKVLFVLADILIGVLIYKILRLRGLPELDAVTYSAYWLYNPMVANISTRGSAESLIGALVLSTLYLITTKRFYAASVMFGLSVHFKIYPIIYSVPLLMLLDDEDYWGIPWKGKEKVHDTWTVKHWTGKIARFVTPTRVWFGVISGGVFLYRRSEFELPSDPIINHQSSIARDHLNHYPRHITQSYSQDFLRETYFYHVVRKDHRHNFSLWFYYIYLSYTEPHGTFLGIATFIPQFWLTFLLGAAFGKDLFFACFIQTFAFVTYQKVCTSQYFMWYTCLLPLILPSTSITFKYKGFMLLLAWVVSQALWLNEAYKLEFLGQNTFFAIWKASLLFFASNLWILKELTSKHKFESVFELGKVRKIWERRSRIMDETMERESLM
ncbi:3079_t:CDS:2 [Paraglomus brasilianum]|uniref:GPI mannosyltransferase 1 n=1 Tax=Paraglomus brasilianum TaxID=144538 RepID=A0A9N8WSE8_9GLOM|nr:3079_t:CDS:2 [Paraglomus brasilianum]